MINRKAGALVAAAAVLFAACSGGATPTPSAPAAASAAASAPVSAHVSAPV